MSAPVPVAGDNPHTGLYQTKQFDQGHGSSLPHGYGDQSVFDALATPPPTGVAAEIADLPDSHGQLPETTDPTVGAGGVAD